MTHRLLTKLLTEAMDDAESAIKHGDAKRSAEYEALMPLLKETLAFVKLAPEVRKKFIDSLRPTMQYRWIVPGGPSNTDYPDYLGTAATREDAEALMANDIGSLDKFIRKAGSDGKTAYYRQLEPGYDVLVGLIYPVEEGGGDDQCLDRVSQ